MPKKFTVTDLVLGAYILSGSALYAWAFPVMWWHGLIATILLSAMAAYLCIYYERIAHWHLKYRASSAIICVVIVLATCGAQTWEAYASRGDNLRANFLFPNIFQLGGPDLDMNATIVNDGGHSEVIQEIGVIEVQSQVDKNGQEPDPAKICENWPVQSVAFQSLPASFGRHQRLGNGDVAFYQPISYAMNGPATLPHAFSISPHSTVVIPMKFTMDVVDKTRNLVVICPAVRVIDSSDQMNSVVCRGAFSQSGVRGKPVTTTGNAYIKGAVILPASSKCKVKNP